MKLLFPSFAVLFLAVCACPVFGQNANGTDAFKKFDKDGDGKLTKAEAGDAPWFDKIDKNSDGVLDAEEVSKLAAARKKAAE